MRKKLLFAITLALLLTFSNGAFAVCGGAGNAGALSPTTDWQSQSVNTYTYYTFVATYAGETIIFSFCDGGGSNSVDTQIEIYNNAGTPIAGFYNDDHCGLGSEVVFVAPAAGTYRIGIYRYYCSTTNANAGVLAYRRLPAPTSADCLGALPLCDLNNSHPVSASGTGNYYDLYDFNAQMGYAVSTNTCPNCLVTGEDHNMWWTYTAQTTGTVSFSIVPVNGGDDYDWAVWEMTPTVNCLDLVDYSANPPLSCNYCGTTGNTGASGGAGTCNGPNGCSNWNQTLNVTAGETYVLNISNFSASTWGYSVNFGGTATIVDNIGPYMDYIVYPPVCGSSSITVQFSERLWCTSVQAADFVVTGPNGTYSTIDAWSAVCEAGAASTYAGTFYDDLWTIELGDYLSHDGNYTLTVLNNSVDDICSNPAPENSLNFTITGITATVTSTDITCNGANNGTITVAGIGGGTAPYTTSWVGPGVFTSNSNNLSGLLAGSYSVTISDGVGQCEYVETVVISEPPVLGYNTSITHPTCGGGGSDGAVLVTGTGGVANYDIQLGASTQLGVASYNFTGLSGGLYTINITDATGCTATGTVNLNNVTVPDPAFTYNGNQCFDIHSFDFTHTGANIAGETYLWTFPGGTPASSTAENPTGVTWGSANIYNVTLQVTAGSCVLSSNQNIEIYASPAPVIVPGHENCGLCDGTASTSIPYNVYAWSTGSAAASISGLCANNYSLIVTNANSCTASVPFTINNSGNIPTATVAPNPPTCFGDCDGDATVNAAGCATYSYNYSSGTTPNNQFTAGLCDGIYSVTVADGNNAACFVVVPFTITDPAAMTLTMDSTDATCGLVNGQASVVVVGHTPPAFYNWTPGGQVTGAITVGAGVYSVTVTDGASCTAIGSITVNDTGAPFTISTVVDNDVQCFGDCDGGATVTAVGAGPFTYLWDNGEITADANALCVGNHTVSVTEGACVATDVINITEPAVLTATTINIVDAHCGQSDGAITANPVGGTIPYVTYAWNTVPFQSGVTATAIPTGNYTVTITDTNGCFTTASGFVGDIGGITVSVAGNAPTCFGYTDGDATATVVGGSPNYTYVWSNAFSETIAGLSSDAINLATGNISVLVTDNFGCTATDNITLNQPAPLNLNLVDTEPTTCFGDCDGEATVSVGGGTIPYTYLWSSGSNPNGNLNLNLCGGGHSLLLTDAQGCTANLNYNITEPAAMLLNISTTPENCNMANGTATATPIGGTLPYGYSWDAGGNPAGSTNTGLTAVGNPYNVTVTDIFGCSTTGSANVTAIAGPTAVISTFNDVSCSGFNDGDATVSVAGGSAPYLYSWSTSPAQTNPTATNLGPGTYHVTVTDNIGCSITASVIIGSATALSLNIVAPPINCFGGTDGNALANISGGTSPYSYLWSDLQVTQTAIGLSAGPYSVTVSDINGCSIIDNVTMAESPAIVITESIVLSNCGQSDGSIDISVSGGSAPYSYLWNTTDITQDILNIPAGAYVVTVTDNKNCTVAMPYAISDINGPVATITSFSDISCNAVCDGTATVGVTGGSGLFQYSWSTAPAQTTPTATNLCAGVYGVIVTDLNTGCVATTGINLIEPNALDVVETITHASCFGNCDGSIDITPTGGTAGYTYNWAGSGIIAGIEDQINLCDGDYSLIIQDANNCVVSRTYTITEPTFITVPLVASNTTCIGNCTGSATAAPFGGTGPYLYAWSDGVQFTPTASSLCSGTHTVTVTDNNGCTESNSIDIASPTQMLFADITIVDAQCNGSSNANISITIIGGTPPYDYVWDNGQVISNPFGLTAGQHCVTVLDNNGCQIDTCVMITEPPALNVTLSATDELCFGSCDGTMTAFPSGGLAPYSYLWSNSEVTDNIINLCAAVYNITLTDDNGCEAYSSTSIASPSVLGISVQNITEPTCGNNDGSITVGATGGTSPFSYDWDPVASNINSVFNVPSGSYTVTITDNNSCSISQSIGLSDITGPQITDIIVTNVNCNGEASGTAQVVFTSTTINNTILWSDFQNADLAINLIEGSYSVTVTDDNGCSAVGTTAIIEPEVLSTSIATYTDVTCAGFCNGTATALVNGGTTPYTFSWSSGAGLITANNLCQGDYTLTVTDFNGCSATTSVSIAEPPPLTVSGVAIATLCHGGSDGMITVTPGGGTGNYFINWPQIGQTTAIVEGLTAAAYTVVIYDATDIGCFISDTYIVGEPAPIDAFFITENATCGFDNGVAYVDFITGGTGSFNYEWDPGNLSGSYQDNLAPGTYNVVITDGNACTTDYNVTVDATTPMNLDNTVFDGVTCYGDSDGFAEVFVSGGNGPYTYNWDPNVTDQSSSNSLSAGVYSIEIIDTDGCIIYAQFPISSPEEVIVYPSEGRTICIGQEVIISASGGGGVPPYTMTWDGLENGTSFLVGPNTTTDYIVTAFDSRGCSSTPGSVLIEVLPPLSLVVTTPSAICQGQVSTLVANATGGDGNYVFDWGNGIVTSSNTLDISPFINTDYTIIVSDGCTTPEDTAYVTASVSPMPEIHITRTPYTGCAPLQVVFDNNTEDMTYSYYWEFDDEDSGTNNFSDLKRPTHIFNETGQYNVTVIVSTSMGCNDSTDIALHVHDSPIADFVAFPWSTGLFEPEITFEDQSIDAIAWEWEFGDGIGSGSQNPIHVYLDQGIFPVMLTVYSQEGCLDTVVKNIEILDDHRIYFPTAINLRSPGNDEFYPIGVGVDEENYQMTIYNRWGEMIFTTNDWYTHWKGRYSMDKGDYVPQGVYTYVVTLRDKYGKDYTYAGNVTVFK